MLWNHRPHTRAVKFGLKSLFILVAGLACSDASDMISPEVTTAESTVFPQGITLRALDGNRQTVAPEGSLSEDLVVRVVDRNGRGVPGVPLRWRLQRRDQGSIAETSMVTDANGEASNQWTVGDHVGRQYLDVRIFLIGGDRITFSAIVSDSADDSDSDDQEQEEEEPEEEEQEEETEEEEEPEEDRPDTGEYDFVLQDTVVEGRNVVVPEGETWLVGGNVEVERANVIVRGTLAMRPGSSLKFSGATPNQYVGGGMMYEQRFDRDWGMWVVRSGALDIRGTPKKGWTRNGMHSTWASSDEMYVAPTAEDDTRVRRWYAGSPIPRVDPRAPAAEVVNVTRDIVIEGPGHIHIHSRRPQRIEYVQLRGLGISNGASRGAVLGRYSLHMHHGEDGTRGTSIRGVAVVDARGKAFVPHMSHGITMTDNVVVNAYGSGLWWDLLDQTNDLLVDSMAVLGVEMPRSVSGVQSQEDGYTLGFGRNMEVRNSFAAGVAGGRLAVGFDWPGVPDQRSPGPQIWTFDQGNVAHNNTGGGLRFWFNNPTEHVVRDYVGYRNGDGGVHDGAYRNRTVYQDVLLLGNSWVQHANARAGKVYRNIRVVSDGHAMVAGHRRLPAEEPLIVEGCSLEAAPGFSKVYVSAPQRATDPWRVHFRQCNLTPEDIQFASLRGGNDGSRILIDHTDGRRWEIEVSNGRRIVRSR